MGGKTKYAKCKGLSVLNVVGKTKKKLIRLETEQTNTEDAQSTSK